MNAVRMLTDCMQRQDPQITAHFEYSIQQRVENIADSPERLADPPITAHLDPEGF